MTYKTLVFPFVALAALLAACTDDDFTGFSNYGSTPLAARRIANVEVVSRADNYSTNFEVGTKYNLWAYADDSYGKPDFDKKLFSNVEGTENDSHYIFLNPAYSKKIKGNIHVFGLTDASGLKVDGASIDAFNIALPQTGDYTDYMRGYLNYNADNPEFEAASYAVIPFSHIMSQVNVKVVQYGEVSYRYGENGELIYDTTPSYLDLQIKEIRLKNASTSAAYCLKTDSYSGYNTPTARQLWTTDAPIDVPVEIPEYQEDGKPVVSRLVLPQEPQSGNEMVLEVVVCGKSAEKFENDLNPEAYIEDGNVVIPLKLKDNSENPNPLKFLPNHSYNLVVTFQADNVRVVTIAPMIYPFFQGEGDDTKDYQDQIMEQPNVFDDIQWCDRYTGADLGSPETIADFQMATGFYYQKNRTIPFYPTEYVGGGVLNNKYWTIDQSQMEKGEKRFDTVRGWMWLGGKIYYKYGGKWVDVEPEKMFERPEVKPVVSFWLPDEMLVTGYDIDKNAKWNIALQDSYYKANGLWHGRESVFWNSCLKDKDGKPILDEEGHYTYGKEGPNRYCSTVQEFIADDGESVRTYLTWYGGEWQPVNKRLSYAMQIEKDTIPRFRTWDSNTTNLPCPPGWRLPTKQDFLTVFPGSAAAGNITFMDFLAFGNDNSTVAPVSDADADILRDENGKELLEIYVKTPFNVKTQADSHFFPPLRVTGTGGYRCLDDDLNKRQYLSAIDKGDPDVGYESEYVISKREFNYDEWSAVASMNIPNLDWNKYNGYASKVAGSISKPRTPMNNTNDKIIAARDAKWGVIYAIKKVGTNEAYRLRYRVKGIFQGTLEAYVLIVEQYKASASDRLKYDVRDINDKQYFLNYSWDYPDATLYFPITGLVADTPMIYWMPEEDQNSYVCSIFNYGIETILLSNEYDETGENQAVLRLKIGGTTVTNQFIFQGMARMALGGQVRPVRTFRTGGD